MIRFIHAADLHLDSPLKGLDVKEGAPRRLIREAPRQALEKLIHLCLDEKVDFLLLAGDVYDGDWKDNATGQFFATQMRRLGTLPVFMIRGNHDAANVVRFKLPLPGNVRVLGLDAPETVRLDSLQVAIHARSFKDREVRENLVREYPEAIPGWFNIGMLHTSLAGSNVGHETYAPCSIEQLVNKGYAYWALGHVHQKRLVHPVSPIILFPGNIQGRHIREAGEKGAYLVEVDDDKAPMLQFRRLDVVRWEEVEHRADAGADLPDVLEAAVAEIRLIAEEESDRLLVVRYRIVGSTKAHDSLQARIRETTETFREMLLNEYSDCVWLESIRFATCSPEQNRPDDHDDVAAELQAVIDEFRREPERLKAVGESMRQLGDKLPSPVCSGEEALKPLEPDWLERLLDRVRPVLNDAAMTGDRP